MLNYLAYEPSCKIIRPSSVINYVLLLLTIVLPFVILEWSPLFVVINRVLFYMAGGLAIYVSLGARFNDSVFSPPYVLFLLLIYSLYGVIRADSFIDLFFESILNSFMFLLGAAIVLWSKKSNLINFPKLLSIILFVHCIDVIFQSVFGFNVLGIVPPIEGRNWGMFVYGAPSAGSYISMMFFVPLFWLRGFRLVVAYVVIGLALFMANDRGPVLQIFSILFVYGLFFYFKVMMLIIVLFASLLYLFDFGYEVLPERIAMAVKAVSYVVEYGVSGLISDHRLANEYSIGGYLEKYASIYNGWFSMDNMWNVLFGSGIGITSVVLEEYAGIGRPHNNVLEFLITFGVLPSIYFILFVVGVVMREKKASIVLMPALFPFSFFSIYSFNWFFLFILLCVVFNYVSRENNMKKNFSPQAVF